MSGPNGESVQETGNQPLGWIHTARLVKVWGHEEEIREWLCSANVIIVVESGEGTLVENGKCHELQPGEAFLFSPESRIEMQIREHRTLKCYIIAFDFYRTERPLLEERQLPSRQLRLVRVAARFSRTGLLPAGDNAAYLTFAAQISIVYEELHAAPSASLFKQAQLYERLHAFLEWADKGWEEKRGNGVERSLEFMNAHYHEPITREMLARIAGMSIWHYSDAFKQHVGKSPLFYLNELRINHAKKALVSSNRLVREIAGQVGFSDEYYFSRKFKQATGFSPNLFRSRSRSKIAALSFPYTGNLLALGIVPYAAVIDQRRDKHRREFFANIPFQLKRSEMPLPEVVEYNLTALSQAKPGMVVCSEVEEQLLQSYALQSELPLFVIPWLLLDWRSQFKQIAALLGKESNALSWLAAYDEKATTAGKQLRMKAGTATWSIFHVKEGRMYVYGKRNAGAVLFEDLKLCPAYNYNSIEVCKQIRPEEMHAYMGDYALVAVEQSNESRRSWEAYKRLEIIQQRQVIEVDEMPWLDYSAYAHNLIIDEILQLFHYPPIPLMSR